MRKISEDAIDAFINGQQFCRSNTMVNNNTLYLFGNAIARYNDGVLEISNAGHETVTTKERLNCLLTKVGYDLHLVQRNWVWQWNDGGSFPSNEWFVVG